MMPRLAISFSGGRSSLRMAALCLEKYGQTHEIKSCFVNTGYEHPETLEFVNHADREIFSGELEWIEAVTNGPGVGMTAKWVDYFTASRNGEPFEAAVEKYGVFNKSYPNCTGRTKTEPFTWYFKNRLGWEPKTYQTAIGIRADEIDRTSSNAKRDGLIYPLADAGIVRGDVNKWCSQFDWDLKLPNDAYGNCVWCWKKSLRKLMTLAKDDPAIFDEPSRLEETYGQVKSKDGKPRTFFRENRSAKDIIELSKTTEFRPYTDSHDFQLGLFSQELDTGGGCGDSCEIGADE